MRSSRILLSTVLATVLTVALLPPVAAGAHPDDDSQDPEEIETSENLEFVEHHWFPEGSDMYFQRREGRQRFDGQVIDETRDLLFAGGDGSSSDVDGRMHVFDVTDPTSPDHLVDIPCQGYHAEVAVYENLMLQGIDSDSQTGCTEDAAERFDPEGVDRAEEPGIRIFDITDPANPEIIRFIDREEMGGWGVHNFTVIPWEGLLYLATSDLAPEGDQFRFGYVDLTDPEFPVTMIPMNDISPMATAGCHDIGLDAERELAFCAAVEQTLIWDISDPREPSHVSTIVNPGLSIHHGARLAPDGTTLVLNDELAGAAFSPGCLGPAQETVGALWFYDTTDPEMPVPQGAFSTDELSDAQLCTSHFYNFIPGTELLVVGWYESGMIVVDYSDLPQGIEHAYLRPGGNASFWAAYYWHGYLYGNSRTLEADGFGGGLWVAALDGVGDAEPSQHDLGTVWSPWTSQLPAPEPEPEPEPAPEPAPQLPTTGGAAALVGLLLLGAAAGMRRRR